MLWKEAPKEALAAEIERNRELLKEQKQELSDDMSGLAGQVFALNMKTLRKRVTQVITNKIRGIQYLEDCIKELSILLKEKERAEDLAKLEDREKEA